MTDDQRPATNDQRPRHVAQVRSPDIRAAVTVRQGQQPALLQIRPVLLLRRHRRKRAGRRGGVILNAATNLTSWQ